MTSLIPDKIASIVVDSVTSIELLARQYSKLALNPTAKDPRKHWGFSSDCLESLLVCNLAQMPCHIGLAAHTSEDKDEVHGIYLRNPKLPGRLQRGIAAAYPEMYRAFVKKLSGQPKQHLVQTCADGMWNCASQVSAPDPMEGGFESIFTGDWSYDWAAPVHALVMGDPGAGKSTFLASFPKPLVVIMGDGTGKEIPFLRTGSFMPEEDRFSVADLPSNVPDGLDCDVSLVRTVDRSEVQTYIYQFSDPANEKPSAWQRIDSLMKTLTANAEIISGYVKGV